MQVKVKYILQQILFSILSWLVIYVRGEAWINYILISKYLHIFKFDYFLKQLKISIFINGSVVPLICVNIALQHEFVSMEVSEVILKRN